VAIIILNWNGWQDTIECLESLYQNNYENFQVFLVDNASTDDSQENIRNYLKGKLEIHSEYFKYRKENKPVIFTEINFDEHHDIKIRTEADLILIKNPQNQGFARGNNTGIRAALKIADPEYVLLLNNDTVVSPDFLIELVKTAESDHKIGFTGPKTYLYDDKDVIQAAGGGSIDFLRGESHELAFMEKDTGKYDEDQEIEYVGGSCLFVKREVLEEVGLLDEEYFMYWEDVDWCFNGRETGYKSFYSNKSKIWHKYGTSSQDHFKTYYHNRNRLYFMRKHAPRKYYRKFILYYIKEVLKESIYQLIYQRNWQMFRSLVKGTIDGFKLKTS
jgi:GT2 family glycosyltransferase